MEEKIIFVDEDGNEIEMYVIEETRINNVNYLLVTDDEGDSEEAEAYILKDISNDEDEEAVYEIVDDESEVDYIGRVFSELLEDIDITTEISCLKFRALVWKVFYRPFYCEKRRILLNNERQFED